MTEMLRVLPYLALSNNEIARRLKISENEVKVHISSLLASTGAKNRTALVIIALGNDLVKMKDFVL